MALTTLASDDFNRSDEDIDASSNWTKMTATRSGTPAISGNKVISSTTSSSGAWWTTAVGDGSTLWAELDFDLTTINSGYVACYLLETPSSESGYTLEFNYDAGEIRLVDSDSFEITTANSADFTTSGTMRLEWRSDGSLVGYLDDVEVISATSANWTPTYVGFILDYGITGTSPSLDNFAGGTILELGVVDATSSGSNTAASTQNVAYPAHNSGDLIVQSVSIDGNVDLSAIPSTGPNGETIETIALNVDPGTAGPQFSAWYWIATANTTAGNISISLSAAEQTSSEAFRVPAGTFDASDPVPFSTTGTQTSGTGATITMPSFGGSGVPAGGLVVAMGGVDADPMDATFSPTGWTDVIDHDQGATSSWVARRDALTTADETISSAAFGINTGDTAACVGFIIATYVDAVPSGAGVGIVSTGKLGRPSSTVDSVASSTGLVSQSRLGVADIVVVSIHSAVGLLTSTPTLGITAATSSASATAVGIVAAGSLGLASASASSTASSTGLVSQSRLGVAPATTTTTCIGIGIVSAGALGVGSASSASSVTVIGIVSTGKFGVATAGSNAPNGVAVGIVSAGRLGVPSAASASTTSAIGLVVAPALGVAIADAGTPNGVAVGIVSAGALGVAQSSSSSLSASVGLVSSSKLGVAQSVAISTATSVGVVSSSVLGVASATSDAVAVVVGVRSAGVLGIAVAVAIVPVTTGVSVVGVQRPLEVVGASSNTATAGVTAALSIMFVMASMSASGVERTHVVESVGRT